MSAERKQVTVLFSDLTGFTALTERLDPEETRAISAASSVARPMSSRGTTGGSRSSSATEAALDICSEWRPCLELNENYWEGKPVRQVRAVAEMTRGRLSDGLREFLAGIRDSRARGYEWSACLAEVFQALNYVSIARMDVKPPLSALVLSPWFIFTQAPFAARKARVLIEWLRFDLPAMNLSGMLGLIDLTDARLLVHQGKRAEARDLVERIKRGLLDAGIEHVPGPVMALAAEIERRA